jgi:hypothetical protein
MKRRNVWMIKRRKRLGFALKPGDAIVIGGNLFGQDFEGNRSPKLRVARTKDFSHAAGAKPRPNLVRTEERAACQRHALTTFLPFYLTRARSQIGIDFRADSGPVG